MYQDVKGKVALITGGTKGIGRGIAEKYASLGINLVLNYSNDDKSAQETKEKIASYGVECLIIKANISMVEDIRSLFAQAIDRFGHLDIVVANAGVELVNSPLETSSEADFDRVYGINVKGTYFTLQEAAKSVVDGGKIILISSTISIHPEAGASIYCSSKAAGKLFVEVLAKELGHRKVTVNSIMPGMIDNAGIIVHAPESVKETVIAASPLSRLGTVEDIARVAGFMASSESAYINGHHIAVNGGSAF